MNVEYMCMVYAVWKMNFIHDHLSIEIKNLLQNNRIFNFYFLVNIFLF